MNTSQVVTLRVQGELKRRLEREAKYQGVSINQLTNHLLTVQLTQLESISLLEIRLSKKSASDLKKKVLNLFDHAADRPVASWDSIDS